MSQLIKEKQFETPCGFTICLQVYEGGGFRQEIAFNGEPVDMNQHDIRLSAAGARLLAKNLTEIIKD